jgi:hypothetical protein
MLRSETENPDEIDLDGHIDSKGVVYIGKAIRQPDGKHICLARVGNCLCRVEVNIKFDPA